MNKNFGLLPICLAACVLSACSGGDDSPSTPGVSGAAIKGVVKNAKVVVTSFPATDPVTQYGEGATDSSGNYQVTFGTHAADKAYTGGPVKITVSYVAPATGVTGTTMTCDYDKPATDDDCGAGIKFGTDFDPGAGFQMTSLQESLDQGAINVTPLTTLLEQRAINDLAGNNGLTPAQAVRSAIYEVSVLTGGIDVVRTRPVDLSKPIPAGTPPQQVAIALLGTIPLKAASFGTPLQTIITSLANSLSPANGAPITTTTYGNLAAFGPTVAADLGITPAQYGTTFDVMNEVTKAGDDHGGVIDTTVDPNVSRDALGRAKAFVGNIRTVVNSYSTAAHSANLAPFESDVDALLASDGVTNKALGKLFDVTLARSFNSLEVALFADEGDNDHDVTFECEQAPSQKVHLHRTLTESTVSIAMTGNSCTDTLNLNLSLPASYLENPGVGSLLLTVNGTAETTASTNGVKVQIADGSKLSVTANDEEESIEDPSNFKRFELKLTTTISTKAASPASFEGITNLTLSPCPEGLTVCPGLLPTTLTLGGTFTKESRSTIAKIELSISEAGLAQLDLDAINTAADDSSTYSLAALAASLKVTLQLGLPASVGLPVTTAIISLQPKTLNFSGGADVLGTASIQLLRDGVTLLTISTTASAEHTKYDNIVLSSPGLADLTVAVSGTGSDARFDGDLKVGASHVGKLTQTSSGLLLMRYDNGDFESLN